MHGISEGRKERLAVPGFPRAWAFGAAGRQLGLGKPPSLRSWQYTGALCGQCRLVPISSSFHHKCHRMNSHPLTIQLQPKARLCLGGTSHLFISLLQEGELKLFGTDRENNAANIYSSTLTSAGLSLALSMAAIRTARENKKNK